MMNGLGYQAPSFTDDPLYSPTDLNARLAMQQAKLRQEEDEALQKLDAQFGARGYGAESPDRQRQYQSILAEAFANRRAAQQGFELDSTRDIGQHRLGVEEARSEATDRERALQQGRVDSAEKSRLENARLSQNQYEFGQGQAQQRYLQGEKDIVERHRMEQARKIAMMRAQAQMNAALQQQSSGGGTLPYGYKQIAGDPRPPMGSSASGRYGNGMQVHNGLSGSEFEAQYGYNPEIEYPGGLSMDDWSGDLVHYTTTIGPYGVGINNQSSPGYHGPDMKVKWTYKPEVTDHMRATLGQAVPMPSPLAAGSANDTYNTWRLVKKGK